MALAANFQNGLKFKQVAKEGSSPANWLWNLGHLIGLGQVTTLQA
jgi:hypothetical protein